MRFRSLGILLIVFIQLCWGGCLASPTGKRSTSTLPPFPTGTRKPSDIPQGQRATPLIPSPTASGTAPPTASVSPVPSLTPTAVGSSHPSPTPFPVGQELTIRYLRNLEIQGSEITFQERLANGPGYRRHLVSYQSEGLQVYGLLTVPLEEPPEGGFQAVVFNHGYIPPNEYRTTARYEAYVNYLARSGLVVFKIDYRGHGRSEGVPTGTYFSPAYTIDAVSALKSLQRLDIVDPQGIGMWGHSMAGNLVLRAMLVEPDIQAGVIWSGAVYSYGDFFTFGIKDRTYQPPPTPEEGQGTDPRRSIRAIIETYGEPDPASAYWEAVSLTENIHYLGRPLQLHHAEDDPVVNVGYSIGLAGVLQEQGADYQLYTYPEGGHNLVSPYFDQAMRRTVDFFRENL